MAGGRTILLGVDGYLMAGVRTNMVGWTDVQSAGEWTDTLMGGGRTALLFCLIQVLQVMEIAIGWNFSGRQSAEHHIFRMCAVFHQTERMSNFM